MKRLYVVTLALSACLLFSAEPMTTRALLPQLGGSSAVWLGALATFQILLLLGYSYAALLTRMEDHSRRAAILHIFLLVAACASLFVAPTRALQLGSSLSAGLRLPLVLGALVGLPFLALSTTAPLLQFWYARREGGEVPYRFFAVSNAASLLALLAYPFMVEPHLGLGAQRLLWKAGMCAFALCCGVLAWRSRASASTVRTGTQELPLHAAWHVLWVLLPAAAAMQLAAVTAHLTEDVASVPLLWVLPLAAYLLSFVLAFEFPALYNRSFVMRALAMLVLALGYFLTKTTVNVPIAISISLFTAELFFASWFCHAEVYALRPPRATQSTAFYLLLAAGGAAGTLAVVVLLPLLTDSNFDLPLAFFATLLVALLATQREGWPVRLLWGGGAVFMVYVLFVMHAAFTHDALFRGRNFYGSLRVRETQSPPQAYISRSLFNGRIQHGMQWFSSDFRDVPLTYYTANSGVGRLLTTHAQEPAQPRSIGVVGLGAGTLAAYGRAGDQLRFYEINPMVIDVAQHLFTYTRNTPARVNIVPGDARLTLASEAPHHFDVLVVDAFSGDSIPIHLLTREAMDLYLRQLAPGGVLAFHISNQYLDLAPVIARLAEQWERDTHQPALAREVDSGPDAARGEARASWVLVTQKAALFEGSDFATVAHPVPLRPDVPLWTDDRSSLLPILRWTGR